MVFDKNSSYHGGLGYKSMNIYKNLLRDFRKFFLEMFRKFKKDNDCNFAYRNTSIKDKLFPYLMYQFSKRIYDQDLVNQLSDDDPKFFEKLVFNSASYLAPKSVITSFQTDKIEF
jgi:hypothetical protein